MDVATFLLIFDYPLRMFRLKGVKFLHEDRNQNGSKYFHFLGLFTFMLPAEMMNVEDSDDEKRLLLATLMSMKNEGGKSYRKKYTRRVEKNGKKDQWTFEYYFDIVPANIRDYEIDREKNTMKLVVKGYGTF